LFRYGTVLSDLLARLRDINEPVDREEIAEVLGAVLESAKLLKGPSQQSLIRAGQSNEKKLAVGS
jgi:hypothetical protein